MAWDSTRVVPWKRLLREWAIYAVILGVAIAIVRRDDLQAEQFAWLPLTLPVYVGFGAVLAKFGYQRKTFKELRAESARTAAQRDAAARTATSASASGRTRPAPTRRTSTGPSNRPKRTKRR